MAKPNDADIINANVTNSNITNLLIDFVATKNIKKGETIVITVPNVFDVEFITGTTSYNVGDNEYCVDVKYD